MKPLVLAGDGCFNLIVKAVDGCVLGSGLCHLLIEQSWLRAKSCFEYSLGPVPQCYKHDTILGLE